MTGPVVVVVHTYNSSTLKTEAISVSLASQGYIVRLTQKQSKNRMTNSGLLTLML